jgi:hypothetical protein
MCLLCFASYALAAIDIESKGLSHAGIASVAGAMENHRFIGAGKINT